MRVLVVTNMFPTPELPGSGSFVAAQVESLHQLGVSVDVLHLHRAERGRRVYGRLDDRVRALSAEYRPSIVHVMYGGVMADVVTRTLTDTAVVVSFCGSDLLGGDVTGVVNRLSRRYGIRASLRAATQAAGIIVKSRNLRDALPPEVSSSRTWIVPNGIDLTRFRPLEKGECRARLGWEEGAAHVLFPAAPARWEKRYSLAAAAVERLGRGGVRVVLHALDGVAHADVPVWINAADVVLLTSVYEGSPNAVKEALACDVCVVSVDVGDVAERIHGVEGCFLAEATTDGVAEKLHLALARRSPVAGRDAVADLALPSVAARLRDIYETVLAGQAQVA